MQKKAHLNLQRAKPDSCAKYTSLQTYYETLIRLHEQLTQLPYEDFEDSIMYEPWLSRYGSSKLEWNHGYYGAARFTYVFTWNMELGWEVSRCL